MFCRFYRLLITLVEMESRDQKELAGGRGKDTLFRISLQNQVDHISIADSKANMIININTIIISLIIAVLGSGITIGGKTFLAQTMLVVPMTILMIGCLVSAIFAVLAARPKLGNHNNEGSPSSLMYFGRINSLDFKTYYDQMRELLSDRQDIYDNLIMDLYQQGKILKRKYSLVQVAYTIFIGGLTLSVVLFLVLWFIPGFGS